MPITRKSGFIRSSMHAGLLAALLIPNARADVLSVSLYAQQAYNWCWVAADQMVLDYMGTWDSQCSMASIALGSNCCPVQPGGHCDVLGESNIQNSVSNVSIRFSSLSWNEVVHEIDNWRPFLFSKEWYSGGGHLMVGSGYKTIGSGSQWVWRNNSVGPVSGFIRYEEYVGGPAYGHFNGINYYEIQ